MYLVIKRLFDLFFTLVLLAILFPFIFIISLLLLASSDHTVFFRQTRMGIGGATFEMLKFATMRSSTPMNPIVDYTLRNDPRVTAFGKFLRMTKLNEVPQLFNVLLGDMSLVGPRPLPPLNFSYYQTEAQAIISKSKPGITGIGSLVFRDEEWLVTSQKEFSDPLDFYKNRVFPYKAQLEDWYYHHKSLWVDIVILATTAYSLLFKKNNRIVFKMFKSLPHSPYPKDVLVN